MNTTKRFPLRPKLLASASLVACGVASAAFAQQALPTIDVGVRQRVAAKPKPAPMPVAAPAPVSAPPIAAPAPVSMAAPSRGPSDVVGYVARNTSSATKTNTPIMDIPQSITVVTEQQLQDRNSVDISKALTYVPGVFVSQGEGNRDQITIRGQDTTADFYTDGVRDDAQYYRDLYNIEAVEVLKGPSALTFGRGGGGGVVNRVTKKANGETIRSFAFQGGSFARKRFTLDVGQAINDQLALRLNAMYEHGYSYRDFVDIERYGVNPTLTWRPLDKTYVTLSYENFYDSRTADRGVPSFGSATVAGVVRPGYPADVPRHAFFGNPDANYSKVDVNRASMIIDHDFDFGVHVRNATVYANYEKSYQNTFANSAVAPTGLVAIDGYLNYNPRQNIFNQTDFTYKWAMTPDIRHTILFGAEVGNQKSDDVRNLARWNNPLAGPQTLSTPFWRPTIFNPVAFNNPNRNRHTDLDVAAGYVQDQIELTKYIDVLAGVRFDSFDLKFVENRIITPPTATSFTGQTLINNVGKWSPRFGVVVKPFEQLSLYGSYSRSFLPSAGDQFNVLDVTAATLDPQSFENIEAGFKAQILPNLYFTGALYQLNRSNQPLATNAFFATLASTQTNGGEIGLAGNVTDEWQVSLGYGHQAAYVKNTGVSGAATPANIAAATLNAGKIVPAVPRDIFSFWNKYDFSSLIGVAPGTLGLGAGVVYNSKFYAALDNAVIVPGSARVDLAAYYKYNEHLSAQVNVENVAGAMWYASAHNNNNIMPGAPRTAYVTVNAKF